MGVTLCLTSVVILLLIFHYYKHISTFLKRTGLAKLSTFLKNAVILIVICLIQLPSLHSFVRVVRFSRQLRGLTPWEIKKQRGKQSFLNWLKDLRTKYGPVFYLWLGVDLTVFLSDPEDIKVILGSNKILYKSNNYKTIEPWLGKGILTSGGERWHRKRKMLTPAFHFKMLEEFKQPMQDNCRIFIEKLQEKANGEAFDIYPYLTLLALDIICETAMGIKVNAQHESSSEYVTAVQKMCHLSHQQSFSFWHRVEFFYRFTKNFEKRKRALAILHGETNRVIKIRKQGLKSDHSFGIENSNPNDEMGIKKRLAFLDILLKVQADSSDLRDDEIREEVDTFMFEGHDTTSSLLAFSIYLLSQHKAEQQKAYEEALSAEMTGNENYKYLEAFIKETLRIYPSVPFYSRKLMEDVNVRGLLIPKDTAVQILAYLAQKDERYFPEPDRFNPERFFVDENKMHPYAFIAFSAGPRNCIGQKYAMQEVKCVLSSLLRTYEILPVEGFVPVPVPELVLKSANGIQVRLRKR